MQLKQHILKLLMRIGLTLNEAKFYLAVQQNPEHTIPEIQEICGFSTATAYRVFEHLHELKFVTSSPENWRKNLEVVSLHSIAAKVAREGLKLRKVELELKKVSNFMQFNGYQETIEPVEIFTDQNQITEHCYKLLSADWKHINCYGSGEKAYDIPGQKAMTDFVSNRAKKGKTINAVFTELGPRTKDLLKKNTNELRNGKLFIDPYCQNSMTYIYDKQVTIWEWDKELGKRLVVINDPGLIKGYAANFQKSWAALK